MPTNPIKEIERLFDLEFPSKEITVISRPYLRLERNPDPNEIKRFYRTQFTSVLKSLSEEVEKEKRFTPFTHGISNVQHEQGLKAGFDTALVLVQSIISKYIDSK